MRNIGKIIITFIFGIGIIGLTAGCAETQLAAHWIKKSIEIDEKDNVSYSGVETTYHSKGVFKIGTPYKIKGVWYTPKESYHYDETGIASWYGPNFHGKKTANGEIYDQYAMTAAHKTLQIPSLVRVTNLENGRSVVVRINDRGPFAHGRIIDMSKRGAELLGFKEKGTARVRVKVLTNESRKLAAAAKAGTPVRIAMNETPQPTNVTKKQPPEILAKDARKAMAQRTLSPQTQEKTKTTAPAMPAPVTEEALQPIGSDTDIAGHYEKGRFMPDGVVKQEPVSGDTSLYVQVGAFTVMDNAESAQNRLNDLATVVITQAFVNGQTFNRVRLGPLNSVNESDRVLEAAISRGFTSSQIIVD